MNTYYSLPKRMLFLIWHHISVFFKTIRCMPPIFIWLLVLFFCFDTKRIPLPLVPTYISAIIYLFFITAWFSYIFLSSFNQTAEYISILKISSRNLYFISKVISLFVICMGFAMIGALYPVVFEIVCRLKGYTAFENGVHIKDISCSFILYTIVGFLGSAISLLFQPDLTKRRDSLSMFMIICFVFAAVTKNQFFNGQNAFKYLCYVFPPIIEIGKLFAQKDVFSFNNVILATLYGLIYSIIAIFIGFGFYSKRLYGPRIASIGKTKK